MIGPVKVRGIARVMLPLWERAASEKGRLGGALVVGGVSRVFFSMDR